MAKDDTRLVEFHFFDKVVSLEFAEEDLTSVAKDLEASGEDGRPIGLLHIEEGGPTIWINLTQVHMVKY